MCGILGEVIYGFESLTTQEKFISLLNLSRSRGPDSQGYFTNEKNFQFGFNRLSILDLSDNGNQPIQSSSGRYTMVFNGEIYNHEELRNSLPDGKYTFKGNGDTESLIACFDHFGVEKTVHRLDGMFAIGIYDNQEKSIHLIRDFAGIKPLFYGWNENILIFASQYNQISRHKNFHNEPIDVAILKLYLSQNYIPSPFGILKHTHSVQPGEIISIDKNGKLHSTNYWQFPTYVSEEINNSNLIDEIESDLDSAVKDELLSDVPLGAFLSGGVDSSLICYFANKYKKNKFNTFSMGSDSAVHDESFQAQKYADDLGTTHYSTFLNAENSLDILKKAVASTGEPFGDFSIIPTYKVSMMAKEQVTVALSGDGGDELFFGYERFHSVAKNHSLWNKPFLVRYLIRGMDKIVFNEKHYNECILAPNPGEAHMGLHSRFPLEELQLIAPNLNIYNLPTNYNIYNYINPVSQDELLYNIRKAEFYGMLQKTLVKVDRASMAHGLEVRVPFLNKDLIEKILKIDICLHKPLQKRKKILFKLLKKCYPTIQPEKIKKGFSISLANWIKEDYQKQFKDKLLDSTFCDSMGFKKSAIERMLSAHIAGHKDYKWPLFSLYSPINWEGQKEAKQFW